MEFGLKFHCDSTANIKQTQEQTMGSSSNNTDCSAARLVGITIIRKLQIHSEYMHGCLTSLAASKTPGRNSRRYVVVHMDSKSTVMRLEKSKIADMAGTMRTVETSRRKISGFHNSARFIFRRT